jgi:hypothetical protein
MVGVKVAVEKNDSHGAILITMRLWQQKRLNAALKERLKSHSKLRDEPTPGRKLS